MAWHPFPRSLRLHPPGGANTISITNVNTAKAGEAIVSGTYTTVPNVTLTKVTVHAYPAVPSGGRLSTAGAKTIAANPNTWGDAKVTQLLAATYTFRADGVFSDNTVYSVFTTRQVNPLGNPTNVWPSLF